MRSVVSVLLLATLLAGCDGQNSPTSPATVEAAHIQGVVTMNGLPIAGATVRVLRDGVELGRAVIADDEGRFCVAAPTFTEVQVEARLEPPAGSVFAVTWRGVQTVTTSDFAPCGVGPECEIVLVADPI